MKLEYSLDEIWTCLQSNMFYRPDDPYYQGALNRLDKEGLDGIVDGISNIPEAFLPNFQEIVETYKEGKLEIKVEGKSIFIIL